MSTRELPAEVPAAAFPRTYRIAPGWLVLLLAGGGTLVLGGAAGVWLALRAEQSVVQAAATTLLCLSAGLIALGALVVAEALRSRVVLLAETIESVGLWRRRRLRRADILGIARAPGEGLVLRPRDASQPALQVSSALRTDAAFEAWLSGLPDLDGEAAHRADAGVRNDPLYGATGAERDAMLARLRRRVRILAAVAWVATGWLVLWPFPNAVAVLAAALTPWIAVAVVALSRGRVRLLGGGSGGHPGLLTVLFVPSLGLGLRALLDVSLLDWRDALPWLGIGSAAMAALLTLVDRHLRRRRAAVLLGGGLFLLLATGPYAWGTAVLANAWLDRSPADVYRPPVLRKLQYGGRLGIHRLDLASWGPYEAANRVTVDGAVYDALKPGDAACVRLRPGALRMAWIVVTPCR